MSGRTVCLLVFTILCPLVSPARLAAWGAEGHEIICEIAWQRLTPESKKLLRNLRSGDREPGRTFADSCTWADRVRTTTHRATYPFHFVNIARGAGGIDLERDCPAFDCVSIAIRRYAVYLAREDLPRDERAEALKFLSHFVGDLHQPLHAGYGEDRGGNEISVEWYGQRAAEGEDFNLHRIWDTEILHRARASRPLSAAEIAAEISDEKAASWGDFDVEGWADESYRLAVEVAYDLPVDGKLGEDYYDRALPVVRERLARAGVRLAHLLNALADGTFHSFQRKVRAP